MAAPKLRPRFEMSTALTVREVTDLVRAKLAREGTINAMFIGDRIELAPRGADVHFWSPQLTLDLLPATPEPPSDARTRIVGRFAPHPHVWSLYLAVHAVGAFATLAAALFGLSQRMIGQTPWALWALPAAPALAALMWSLGFVGQNLGAEQMYALRRFIDECVEAR